MTSAEAVPARHRVFFALWPDAAAASSLSALAARFAGLGGRAMRTPTLHLTLAFIGAVATPDIAVLGAAAEKVGGDSVDIKLDRLGYWQRGGIVHAYPAEVPATWTRIAGSLATALEKAGFVPAGRTDRGQAPHVTLLRNAPSMPLPETIEAIGWRATEFMLVESHLSAAGPDYRVLARFPLAGGSMR